MPPDNGVWGHNQQGAAPIGPPSGEGHPEQSVDSGELGALGGCFQQSNLLTECEVLQSEGAMGVK